LVFAKPLTFPLNPVIVPTPIGIMTTLACPPSFEILTDPSLGLTPSVAARWFSPSVSCRWHSYVSGGDFLPGSIL